MPQVVPRQPSFAGPGGASERLLFEALGGLDDEHWVFHRYDYMTRAPLRDGEADLLVVHPRKGLLVLECKGEGVRRDADGQWWRGGARLKSDPFSQVQRAHHRLVELLGKQARDRMGLSRLPFAHGRAVAFVRAKVEAADLLPPDIPRELVLDADDLPALPDRIARLYRHWGAGDHPGMDAATFREFRTKVLYPEFEVRASLGARVQAERRELVRLSEEQTDAVESVLANRRVRVQGSAGTGKTLVATEVARRLADEGHEVLLLCFNRALGEELGQLALGEGRPGKVDAMHFHRLCHRAFAAIGQAMEVPEDPAARALFWDRGVLDALLEALAAGELPRYDAVIVDEAQDFVQPWWTFVEELLTDRERGRLVLFYDPEQNIFERREDALPELATLVLRRAYRCTKAIALAAAKVGGISIVPALGCPEGEPPQVRPQKDGPGFVAELDALVTRLVREGVAPERIAILTPHRRPNSSLAEVSTLAGLPLHDSVAEAPAASLRHATISGFKGLEADVVVLADLVPGDPRCDRRALYTALTRAKHRAFVFQRGSVWPR